VTIKDITRPPKEIIQRFAEVSSATTSGDLSKIGIRSAHILGPVARTPGKRVVGPAVTLQFMPKREDIYRGGEYVDPESQIHRHALYAAQPGDVVVVDARGDLSSGCFGEMMLTYLRGKGGLGVVIDGCIRDFPHAKDLGLGIWTRGVTPNFHTQTNIFPFAYNVPIACGGCFVNPGDIIVADDDGAVVVPAGMAEELLERAQAHGEWEDFSRMKLSQGGDLRKYYPLSEEAKKEYEQWRAAGSPMD
jgi:regulator of RNase E activity RraA